MGNPACKCKNLKTNESLEKRRNEKNKNRSTNAQDAACFTNFLCLVSEMHLMTKLKPQDKRPDMEQLIYILLYSLLK